MEVLIKMNYAIEFNQMGEKSISKRKFDTFQEGEEFLNDKDWSLIDDMVRVWEGCSGFTAKIIAEDCQMEIQFKALRFVKAVRNCFEGSHDTSDEYILETFKMLQTKYKELIPVKEE